MDDLDHENGVEPAAHVLAETQDTPEPEPAPAPVPAAPESPIEAAAELALVTLDDWCAAKSGSMRGHVELISAFATLERAKHNLLASAETFEAAFHALRTRPAQ